MEINRIFESPIIEGSAGSNPFRIVAYERDSAPRQDRPYVTHIEVDPREGTNGEGINRMVGRYLISGNYDLTFEEAIEDAMARYEQKNRRVRYMSKGEPQMTSLDNISKFIDHISNRLWEDIKMDIDQIDNDGDDLWDWRTQTTDEIIKELGIKFSDLAFEYKDDLDTFKCVSG